MKSNYLNNLTPLRGIAALFILIFHIQIVLLFTNPLTGHWDTALIWRMHIMVDFFFILSGFIMYHVYGDWFRERVSWGNFKKFTLARFARVYPLHIFTLFVLVIVASSYKIFVGSVNNPILQVTFDNKSILANLLLIHSMNTTAFFTWNHASWSISTEWWAYMLFPFLVVGFSYVTTTFTRALILAFCLLGYLVIVYYLVALVTVPDTLPFAQRDPKDLGFFVTYQFGFFRCIVGFIIGMVCYQCYTNKTGLFFLGRGDTILGLLVGLFISMHYAVADYVTVWFFPLIILSAAYGSNRLNKILNIAGMQKLGDLSFSIYLTHQPLLFIFTLFVPNLEVLETFGFPSVKATPTAWLICGIFLLITLMLASLSYTYIEVPARTIINRPKEKTQ